MFGCDPYLPCLSARVRSDDLGADDGEDRRMATGARQMLGVNPTMRRAWLAQNTGVSLDAAASTAFTDDEPRANIENLVGAAHVPLGIAGPIRVNGDYADGSYYVPFATT